MIYGYIIITVLMIFAATGFTVFVIFETGKMTDRVDLIMAGVGLSSFVWMWLWPVALALAVVVALIAIPAGAVYFLWKGVTSGAS